MNVMNPCAAARTFAGRLLIHVDLPGHEEEVVTDPVQQDAAVQHPHRLVVIAVREQHVARHPRRHADEQHLLDAQPSEEPRHQEHEHDLGHLAERHLPRRVGHAELVEERIGERVVELQRNADEERTEHEDRERSILLNCERIEPEHVANAHAPRCLGRRVRQHQTKDGKHKGRRRPPAASAVTSLPRRACRRQDRRRSSRSCRARAPVETRARDLSSAGTTASWSSASVGM